MLLTEKDNVAEVYLNELCVNVQSCDVILNCPVVAQVLDILLLDSTPATRRASDASTQPERTVTSLPFISASVLPLLYINSGRMRLFVPRIQQQQHVTSQVTAAVSPPADTLDSVSQQHDGRVRTLQESHAPVYVSRHERSGGKSYDVIRELKQPRDDVFVFELLGLSLLPQADNPLPR